MKKVLVRAVAWLGLAACLMLVGYALFVRFVKGRAQGEPVTEAALTPEEMMAKLDDAPQEDPLGRYTFSLELDDVVDTDVYHFGGNGIELAMGAYRSGAEQGTSEYFSVELHRMSAGLIDTLVGTQTLSRWGASNAIWFDVEEGDYYFRFVKDPDGQRVIAESVEVSGCVVAN